MLTLGFPGGSEVKASACNAGDLGSIPELGRSPGEGNSNPLQYSCLENPMDGGAWWATVQRVAKSRTRLSDFTFTFMLTLHFHYLLFSEYLIFTLLTSMLQYFIMLYVCVCWVVQSCLTLCDPLDCSPPGSSVQGIFQARILEWVAISSSRGSFWSRNQTCFSCIGRWILYH